VLEDKILVSRLRRGDAEALCRIYEKYRDNLLRLAVSLSNDTATAEDIVHDVFASFIRQARQFRLTGSLKSYLATCVANRTIQDILVGISGETETLNQLKIQLSRIQDASPSLQYAITQEGQVCAASIWKEKAYDIVRVMPQGDKGLDTTPASARILAGDEAFFERNRAHWSDAIAAIVAVLDSELPYPQMYTKLDESVAQMTRSSEDNPDATFTGLLLPAVSRIYLLTTRLQAHFNALRAATDLYTIQAQTGRLPEALPADAPGDPFSGKAFLYEKAEDHFTLRCREKEGPEKAEANQYEFKIAR
jgi:hypothetical protein